MEQREVSGYTLYEVDRKEILAIKAGRTGPKISLGDVVTSAGRLEPAGLKGLVFRILEPGKKDRTSDVIDVRWEDGRISSLKFKDIVFPKEPEESG